jgi:hypothetical protein
VQDIEKDVVFTLLQAAITEFDHGALITVAPLSRLPAAQQLTSADALQLLKAAGKRKDEHDLWAPLCKLPAAQQLERRDVMQLLQAGLGPYERHADCVSELCGLPAAQQLSSDDVLQLLRRAVAVHSNTSSVAALTAVAAAQRLTMSIVAELIDDATESGAHGCIQPFQRLLLSLGSAS